MHCCIGDCRYEARHEPQGLVVVTDSIKRLEELSDSDRDTVAAEKFWGEWFTEFGYDWDGNKLASTFKSVQDFASLTIFVVNGSYNDKTVIPSGTDCTPIIKIDNIRVVSNK